MKATFSALAAVLVVGTLAVPSRADWFQSCQYGCGPCLPLAANAFSPCCYVNLYPSYGSNYICPPPGEPFQGFRPAINQSPQYPSNPWMRGPRDFFMLNH